MVREARTPITPQLVFGVFLTLLGVVLTLDQLEMVEFRHVQPFWPLLLVAIGTAMLMQRQDSSGRTWGLFWTGLGGWLLLHSLGVITVGIGELIGPLILIVIGATVLRHTLRPPRPAPPAPPSSFAPPASPFSGAGLNRGPASPVPPPIPTFIGDATSTGTGRVSLFTFLGESKRRSNDNPFRGGDMTAVLGGCVLDLRQASIAPGEEAVIDILAVMAGHEIWVPQGWAVDSDIVHILGGSDDKRLPPIEPPPLSQPRLRLRGVVVMGGIVIKH